MKKLVVWCDELVEVPGVSAKYWDSETAFQIYVATWLRKRGVRFHHSANERDGGKAGLMAKLKGQSKGFPDIVIFGSRMAAIELKVEGGRVGKEQEEWLAHLSAIGWQVGVCWTFEEVKALVSRLEL